MKTINNIELSKVGRMKFMKLVMMILMTLGAKLHADLIYYVDITHASTGYAMNWLDIGAGPDYAEVNVAPGVGPRMRIVYPLGENPAVFFIEMKVGNRWKRLQYESSLGLFLSPHNDFPENQYFELHRVHNGTSNAYGIYAAGPEGGGYLRPRPNPIWQLAVRIGPFDPRDYPDARWIIRGLSVQPPSR